MVHPLMIWNLIQIPEVLGQPEHLTLQWMLLVLTNVQQQLLVG